MVRLLYIIGTCAILAAGIVVVYRCEDWLCLRDIFENGIYICPVRNAYIMSECRHRTDVLFYR